MSTHRHNPSPNEDRTAIVCMICREILTPKYLRQQRMRLVKDMVLLTIQLREIHTRAGALFPEGETEEMRERIDSMEKHTQWLSFISNIAPKG